jgi:DNA polymerase IIIc chi subunit
LVEYKEGEIMKKLLLISLLFTSSAYAYDEEQFQEIVNQAQQQQARENYNAQRQNELLEEQNRLIKQQQFEQNTRDSWNEYRQMKQDNDSGYKFGKIFNED